MAINDFPIDDDLTLPAPDRRTDLDVTLDSPNFDRKRKQAIRILLPRDPDALEALPEDIRGALVKIVDKVAGEPGTAQIEVLMFNGPRGLEIILHPTPSIVDGRAMQSNLTWFTDQLHSPVINNTIEAIKKSNDLPDSIGIERGMLNLDPVGVSDVTTTRLLVAKDSAVTQTGKFDYSPLQRAFQTYQQGTIPFLYQVILEKSKQTYNVSVRMATYRPKHTYSGTKGFAQLVTQGHPLDLSNAFKPYRVTSNHKSLADGYWNVSYTDRIDGTTDYETSYNYRYANQYTKKMEVRDTADKIKELVLGKGEHRNLLDGNASFDPAYKTCDRFGRFEINPAQLKPFLELVPIQFSVNPWLSIQGRSAPQFRTDEIINSIAEPTQGLETGTTYVPETSATMANEGAAQHRSLGKFTQQWFTENGDDIEEVVQTSESVPDYRLTPDDGTITALDFDIDCETVPVEVESTNVDKGANTLVNAERAYACDQHVIFVYPSKKEAKRGYSHLSKTYKRTIGDGAVLYNDSEYVICPDERIPVYEGSGSVEWTCRTDTLEGTVDGTTIAAGPADADVGTFDYDCHYYQKVDGIHRIETADGELKDRYRSNDAFTASWTRVTRPHLPVDQSYLAFTTVMYRNKEEKELYVYTTDYDWDINNNKGKRTRYQACNKAFCDEHLVEKESAELPHTSLLDRISRWYRARSTHATPVNSEIGRTLPERLKESKAARDNNKYKYYDGYSWRIKPDIDSPHRPGIEAGDLDDSAPDEETDPTEETTDEY
ncbi:hypothetical protein [Halostagnicola sp. A-GB9-2]|uniref:hypothetical protein n=1 Tax=Halostagnicola sp. A-GB9-2 TaxID=3048066 RepID=UPI0024C0930E|nr:hypothetical protein [Halostagnicola sp. A-GB9-2]MDJ1434799.1 hypothetical protein [Halostagnicola sp. A-GB9-2]